MRIFGDAVQQITRGLGFATARHSILAKNVANADTPGYRARDLVFDDYLRGLPRPSSGELSPETPPIGIAGARVVSTQDGPPRSDGNSVRLDQEMARIAENTLYQHTLVQLLAGQFNSLKQAISGRV